VAGGHFALSTLAVRGELLERIVLSLLLDLILPMATPPLGTTARLMLAVAFGLLGALLGWVAVRKLAPREAYAQKAWQEAQREANPLRRRSATPIPIFPLASRFRPMPNWASMALTTTRLKSPPMNRPAGQSAKHRAQLFAAPAGGRNVAGFARCARPAPPAEEPSWDWKPQPVVVQPPLRWWRSVPC
jgi:hypothetical protein